jgi:hypothetical protein
MDPKRVKQQALSMQPSPGPAARRQGGMLRGHSTEILSKKHYLTLGIWFCFLVASPFYVFPSGNPQPGDGIFIMLAALTFSGVAITIFNHRNLYLTCALFLTVVTLVNLSWWTVYYEPRFLMSTVFYVYNLLVLITVANLFCNIPNQLAITTRYGILICLFIELFFVFFVGSSHNSRGIGTFNNPNQLGYWALISCSVWLVTKRDETIGPIDTLAGAIFVFLVLESLSKAALVGVTMLIIFALIFQRLKGSYILGSLVCLVAVVLVASFIPFFQNAVADFFGTFFTEGFGAELIQRFENVEQERERDLSHRGYDRIFEYPEHLILGSGEGAFHRFTITMTKEIEFHSIWGTIIYGYGIAGTLTFFSLLYVVFRRAPIKHFIYFLPMAAYGITHQGLRFSMLWIFFGMVFGLAHGNKNPLPPGQARPPLQQRPGTP